MEHHNFPEIAIKKKGKEKENCNLKYNLVCGNFTAFKKGKSIKYTQNRNNFVYTVGLTTQAKRNQWRDNADTHRVTSINWHFKNRKFSVL